MALVELMDIGKNLKIKGEAIHYSTLLRWYKKLKKNKLIIRRPLKWSAKRNRKVYYLTQAEAEVLEAQFYFFHPEEGQLD